jgi:hypothetical protein
MSSTQPLREHKERIAADILIARINNPKTIPDDLKAEALAKEFQIIFNVVNNPKGTSPQ